MTSDSVWPGTSTIYPDDDTINILEAMVMFNNSPVVIGGAIVFNYRCACLHSRSTYVYMRYCIVPSYNSIRPVTVRINTQPHIEIQQHHPLPQLCHLPRQESEQTNTIFKLQLPKPQSDSCRLPSHPWRGRPTTRTASDSVPPPVQPDRGAINATTTNDKASTSVHHISLLLEYYPAPYTLATIQL